MDEDKISPDTSDKRKVDDDNTSPKPNPKRIKLVRPVFSPVAKPTISQTEITKPDVQPPEVPKQSHVSDKIFNADEKPDEQGEMIKKPIDPIEIVKKCMPILLVPEEQVDSSSDALDLQNIFSEETKKELEHLKKNIFKIEDDGSSSENDSQPKRPRLKRPTFVKSAIENKVETTDVKTLDKTDETVELELVKSAGEENVIKIDEVVEKQLIARDNIVKVEKNPTTHATISDEDYNSFLPEDSSNASEIVDNLFEVKSATVENTNKVVEDKLSTSITIDKIIEEKITREKNVQGGTKKIIEIECDNPKIKQNTTQFEVLKQENTVEKEMPHTLVEKKSIDKDKINQTAIEINIKKEPIDKDKVFKTEIKDTVVTHCGRNKIYFKDNARVVIERYIDKKCNNESQGKSSSKLKPKDNKNLVETNNDNSVTKINKENNLKNEIECPIIDTTESTQVGKMVKTIENSEVTDLENKNKMFIINAQEDLEILTKQAPNTDETQNNEEHESQIFKSDILKAALMSKKSPESLGNSSERLDQLDINPTTLETKTTDVLPTIGQEDIVNKIETEIKLSSNDNPTNIKKSQNKILSNIPETNISKEAFICLNENIVTVKHDDPPKWGSAKMNEVEKFLNDSNVTITPICNSQETPKLGKITLKLPKVGNPEIKSETTVRPDVKSELIKKITNKQIAMGDSPLKNALAQPSKSFSDFATIRPAPKPSAEQIALLEQQILNTPKKRGRPSKALAQQKQLLLQYHQQQQQHQQKVPEGSTEDEAVFHVPLFDMEDMSGGAGMFESFDASTPKRGKSIRGKGSRGRRGRGGGSRGRGRDGSDSDTTSNSRRMDDETEAYQEELNQDEETKQVAMIEAERLRKEEERERKMEARKKKLKERNDALKEKKLKKKQKAEERRLQWHEKKRLMQEEKARAAEMKKSLPPPQNFDDETRMSADCNNSRSQTPARNFIIGMF